MDLPKVLAAIGGDTPKKPSEPEPSRLHLGGMPWLDRFGLVPGFAFVGVSPEDMFSCEAGLKLREQKPHCWSELVKATGVATDAVMTQQLKNELYGICYLYEMVWKSCCRTPT